MLDDPTSQIETLDERLAGADPPRHRVVIDTLVVLLASDRGIEAVYERIERLVARGFFADTVWENPARLLPPLVKTSLLGAEPHGIIEALSELRLLALAQGQISDPRFTDEQARSFLEEAVVLNLDLVQLGASEEHRLAGGAALNRARRVIGFVVDRLCASRLERVLLREITEVCRQRRILGAAAVDMIRRAQRYADPEGSGTRRALARYVDAIEGVTALARRIPDHARFAEALRELGPRELAAESRAFGRSLRSTGLASPQHAILVRMLSQERDTKCLAFALNLDRVGRAELARHEALVAQLVQIAVTPASPLSISGLSGALRRAALSMPGVSPGLRNLLRREPSQEASQRLLASRPFIDEPSWPQALLVAGAIAVIGQPLGVGQGDYPSCQSARAISLWSQVAPGYLLELLTSAAFDDCTRIRFRGFEIRSRDLPDTGFGADLRLDPASVVLVPHLHRTYQAMLDLVSKEGGDAHRWVNPGLYGPWVPTGFECVFDTAQRPLPHAAFVRMFLAVHHPEIALVEPIHPRPLGLVVTSAHGQYLGLHAISLQRVHRDPSGAWRAYFFNPNDDGRQNWGQGIVTSTSGHGEIPGESSLPLAAFASRIYAFHYHDHEVGDVAQVDRVAPDLAGEAERLVTESWGQVFSRRVG
jgi:hypothetical protein